ncbi:MAG TPA: BatA and WFA domain-containing protein [Ktedonobacteraceae bacterium]|nr:BatA and WFA domain-containing protein [Ktedonobacteraceae bacterium]
MNFLVPAALAFAAIIPIILLFYFMRPKRQERVVGSTLLWQQALQDLQASQPWQRLRITPLLLLQLLAAVVIVLVLTRPAIFTTSQLSGDTIIILQSSASMQATDVAPDRFTSARNTIADLIDSLGPDTRISLITMARTPQVLIADSQDKTQLNAALQRAQVTNQDADLEQALSLAASLAAGHANAQVLVVGDGHVINADQALVLPFPVRYLSVGTDAPNSALLALTSRVTRGQLFAFAQVANYSHQQRSIPVELYGDGRLVNVQTVTLPAGATGALQWGPLTASTRFLHAHLTAQDAMSIDHDAWAIVGGSIHGRVLLVTRGNTFLRTALRLQPTIDLFETTPEKYGAVGNYDLTVFDDFVPKNLPNGSLFFVNPPSGSYLFGASGPQIQVSHFSAGNDSINLLNAVDLGSIHVIHASHQLQPAVWAQTIISAPETPLLIAGEVANRHVAVLGFDLHDSDLPLQPAFPILMQNMTNWFLPQPVGNNGQVSAGVPVSVQTWPGADQVTITDPNHQTTTVGPPFPVTPFAGTNKIGLYQVTQRVRGQELQGAFAVNLFDPTQSRLTPASALPVLHSTAFTPNSNTVSHQLREIWPWIAAFLLLILCAEWWLFSQGYKQRSAATPARTSRIMGGKLQVRTATNNTLATTLQNQLQERYQRAKKQVLKTSRRARKNLTRTKGGNHVNL